MYKEFLSPKSDIIFKLLFGDERSLGLLTDFLQSVLRLPASDYDEVTLIDPHLKREFEGDKLGILDVRVRTKTKKIIDIEIQLLPSPELRERVVFYCAKMITEQVSAGKAYSNIKRVVSIIITDYTLIPENAKYHNRYTLFDSETNSEFTDIIEINTLELAKLPENSDGSELWNWMRFLSARGKEDLEMVSKKSPQVKKAVMRLMELSNDERTRLLEESYQKKEWDRIARERGAVRDIAKKLLISDVPVEKITSATGLSREEVEGLKDAE